MPDGRCFVYKTKKEIKARKTQEEVCVCVCVCVCINPPLWGQCSMMLPSLSWVSVTDLTVSNAAASSSSAAELIVHLVINEGRSLIFHGHVICVTTGHKYQEGKHFWFNKHWDRKSRTGIKYTWFTVFHVQFMILFILCSFSQLTVWSIKGHKIVENIHHIFSEPSSNFLFCSANGPKPKNI